MIRDYPPPDPLTAISSMTPSTKKDSSNRAKCSYEKSPTKLPLAAV